MNILSTEYGPVHKALEIYVAGCKAPHCKGCHNPESWNFTSGISWKTYKESIKRKVELFLNLIDSFWVLGGEPLDQDTVELVGLLEFLKSFNKPIWLFTRYELPKVPHMVAVWCDYIKTGAYNEKLCTDMNIQYGVKLATSNQNINCLTECSWK